jgi:hypothetical protein
MLYASLLTKPTHKHLLLFIGILFCLGVSIFLHSPKASAACGVNIAGVTQWEGAIVVMDWQHGDGSGTTQSNNTQVHIWSSGQTGAGPYNNEVHIDSSNAEIGSVNSNGSGAGGTFSQVATNWAGTGGGCGGADMGHSSAVVLGYGNTSPCASGCGGLNGAFHWALRCGTLERNEQTFWYTGVGVPAGARSGGTWDVDHGGLGNNGANDTIRLVYHEPPPPLPISNPAQISCTAYQTDTPATRGEYETFWITDSSGNTELGYTNTPKKSSTNPGTSSGSFTPLGQQITLWAYTVRTDGTHGSTSSWSTSGNCFGAYCSMSIDGNLPNGDVLPGSTFTVNYSITNASQPGVTLFNALPRSGGPPSYNLDLTQPGPSPRDVNYAPGIGPGATQGFSYTDTAPSSGTYSASGYVDYYNDFAVDTGGGCSASVLVYQPPLENIDGVSCANLNLGGWAFAQNGDQGQSINVAVYADAARTPMGPGNSGTPGVYAANVYRPDVNAAYGITGNHGFNIPVPLTYQDGQNHTFYVYAKDPEGILDSGAATIAMTGCEPFQLLPGVNSGKLSPTFESPSSFDGTATVAVTYTNGATGVTGSAYNYSTFPGTPASVTYTFTKNGTQVGSGSVPSPTGNGRFNNTTYTPPALSIPPGTYQMGYIYCLNVTADEIKGIVQNDGTILRTDQPPPPPTITPSCDTVHNEPYTHFFGSDVNAGGGFGNGCTTDTTGGIYTFTRDSGGNPNGNGSGTQFGAQALGIIEGFGSANLRTSSPTGLRGLTFANSSPATAGWSPDAPRLGGNLGLSSYCLPDYYGAKPAGLTAQPSGNINIDEPDNAGSNPKLYNGPVTINNVSKIGNAANEAIYVNGDVYIRNNITYTGAGSWSSITQIPSLYVVATGNIYIDPGVTRLDGIYIAEPNSSGTGGIINTCVSITPFHIYKVSELGGGICDSQLTVNGAFVADKLFLDRSYSSLRYSQAGENLSGASRSCGTGGIDVPSGDPGNADCAAEIFNFSPELYLSQPANTPNSGPTTGIFDYITSLSPVL